MNNFVDNPFLFFVDDLQPDFTDKSIDDSRKIIELSDIGCDAITPNMVWKNNTSEYPVRSGKMKEGGRTRYEEKSANKLFRDRLRQTDRTSADTERVYSISKENDNLHQHRRKKSSTNDDVNVATARRILDIRGSKANSTLPLGRPSSCYRNDDKFLGTQSEIQQYHDPAQSNSRRESMNNNSATRKKQKGSRSSPSNCLKTDQKIIDEKLIIDKGKPVVALEPDYPEIFDKNVSKDRWQILKAAAATDKNDKQFVDETLQKNQRTSRYQKSGRISGSATTADSARRHEESRVNKVRSRPNSPSNDRQKRTRSFSKTLIKESDRVKDVQNPKVDKSSKSPADDLEPNREKNVSPTGSSEKVRKFVDRAVDKGSLPEILKVSTSIDATVAPEPSIDIEKNEEITGYWEFVPLEGGNNKKYSTLKNWNTSDFDQKLHRNANHPLSRYLVNKRESPWSELKENYNSNFDFDQDLDFEDSHSYDPPVELNFMNVKRTMNVNPKMGMSQEFKEDGAVNLNVETIRDTEKYSENGQDRSWGDPVYQRKSDYVPFFGWSGKNRHLKRSNNALKPEIVTDKKKKTNNEILNEERTGPKIDGGNSACLKRKLEESQAKNTSPSKSSLSNIEKKVRSELCACSGLPVRIGKRFRSSNPVAWKFVGNLKNRFPGKGQDKTPEDLNTARSRTKPRIKSSLEHHHMNIDAVKTSTNPRSMECFRTDEGIKDYSQNRNEKSMKNGILNGFIKNRKDEKLGDKIANRDAENFKRVLNNTARTTNKRTWETYLWDGGKLGEY